MIAPTRADMLARIWDGEPELEGAALAAAAHVESFPVRHGKDGRFEPGPHTAAPLTGEAAREAIPYVEGDTARDAEDTYMTMDGFMINAHLRGDTGSEYHPADNWQEFQKANAATRGLDSAFVSAVPLAHAVQVDRGVSDPEKVFGTGNLAGAEFTDAGFVSASTDELTAKWFANARAEGPGGQGGALVHVIVPVGGKALNLGDDEWGEVLLPRDSKFRIVSDGPPTEPFVRYKRLITMEVVL